MFGEDYDKACRMAYKMLAYRDRTQYEISRKLKEKGFDSNTIVKVIEFLQEYNYVDDLAFTKKFIEKNNLHSKARIRGKLQVLGVRESVIDRAFNWAGAEFEYERALVLALRQESRGKSIIEVVSFLKNRGFNHSTVLKVSYYLEALRGVDNLDS